MEREREKHITFESVKSQLATFWPCELGAQSVSSPERGRGCHGVVVRARGRDTNTVRALAG